MRRSCSAAAGVRPATLSGVAEGSEGGCNSELGFCGISGKSGDRVGGLTGGGSFWALWPFGWGIASVLKTLRLTGSNLVCSDELLGRIDWVAAMRGPGESYSEVILRLAKTARKRLALDA
jgi:hypothetical protein